MLTRERTPIRLHVKGVSRSTSHDIHITKELIERIRVLSINNQILVNENRELLKNLELSH